MARKERKPRRPSFEEQAARIAELEGKLHPLQTLYAWQHNLRAVRALHAFTVPGVYDVDVRVTLWLGPRRAGMVVAECELRQRPDQDGTQPDPIWCEPCFAYDLAKQWEGSGNPYYQHAATKLRALEASMYEEPRTALQAAAHAQNTLPADAADGVPDGS